MAANINQTGRACDTPTGLMSQSRLSGAVGDTPSGTSSFYIENSNKPEIAENNLNQNKSAITDHVNQESHVINWNKATIIACESDKATR